MREVVTFPTWDEYLDALGEYVGAMRRAGEAGFASLPDAPLRPREPLPVEHLDRADRLRQACDQLIVEISTFKSVVADRLLAARSSGSPGRPASYVETNI
jgi:hypothetical protein